MKNVKKSWVALLLGALLLTILVGVVWAKPKVHHGGYHYKITIPAGDFIPNWDGTQYVNNGDALYTTTGSGIFTAPVPILPGNRTVEGLSLIVYDNNSGFGMDACVSLYRLKTDGTDTQIAQVCSTGASTASPRTFTTGNINPDTIWGGHGPYLYLSIPTHFHMSISAVQIGYY